MFVALTVYIGALLTHDPQLPFPVVVGIDPVSIDACGFDRDSTVSKIAWRLETGRTSPDVLGLGDQLFAGFRFSENFRLPREHPYWMVTVRAAPSSRPQDCDFAIHTAMYWTDQLNRIYAPISSGNYTVVYGDSSFDEDDLADAAADQIAVTITINRHDALALIEDH